MHAGPPRRLVTIAMQLAMMQSADGNREFVADLASKRARLGEAKMTDFARRATANNARLRRDEFAMLFVSQANGLGGDASAASGPPPPRRWRRAFRMRPALRVHGSSPPSRAHAEAELVGRQAEARTHFEDGQSISAQTARRGRACCAVSPQAPHGSAADVGQDAHGEETLQARRGGARQRMARIAFAILRGKTSYREIPA